MLWYERGRLGKYFPKKVNKFRAVNTQSKNEDGNEEIRYGRGSSNRKGLTQHWDVAHKTLGRSARYTHNHLR